MYSKIVLLVLFLLIVVLGVFLNKKPAVPEEYIDAGFCAKNMPGNDDCKRFYMAYAYQGGFSKLDDVGKVSELNDIIRRHNQLMKDEPETYPYMSARDQYIAIEKARGAGTAVSSEGGKATARLGGICPSNVYTDAEGKLHVEPSGKTFDSMTDYTNWLAGFAAQNNCKAVAVTPYKGPIPGALGGGGTGTASANQIAGERNDRTVINAALDELYQKWDTNTTPRKDGSIPVRTFQFPAPGEQTYAKTPINSLDDYEYNRVFELENKPRMAPLSKEVKSNLLGAMQLDWPTLPYSSDTRTKLEEQFVDARMQDGFREPKSGVFFRNMEGVDISPPDQDAAAAREAKILSGYQPTAISEHIVDDEYERVAKVVAQQYSTDPDWEPVVEKRGPHQYAVTELRPRMKKNAKGNEETVWEDEAKTTVADAKQQGLLQGAEVKPNVLSIQDNLQDPFFAKTGVADHSNDTFWKYSDFNKWSPNLERQFAPTDPTNKWH
jgi:hypothetical protein